MGPKIACVALDRTAAPRLAPSPKVDVSSGKWLPKNARPKYKPENINPTRIPTIQMVEMYSFLDLKPN